MVKKSRFVLGGVAALTSLSLAIPASVTADGAPGAGDPYYPSFGNGGYDVQHYGVYINYYAASNKIAGSTTVQALATETLPKFNLDLLLKASKVYVEGVDTPFTQSGRELSITPKTPIASGATMKVKVVYAGNPSQVREAGGSNWMRTTDGGVIAAQPSSAPWWFASNDHPSDKATMNTWVNTYYTVEALSNGRLQSSLRKGDKRLWKWTTDQPMATYAANLAVGQFDITKSTTAAGVQVLNAVPVNSGARGLRAKRDLALTGQIADFYAGHFGPYPFSDLGGVATRAPLWGVAPVGQTRPMYSLADWAFGQTTESIALGVARQWFSASVSPTRWSDAWVGEGAATYAAWMWGGESDPEFGVSPALYFQILYDSMPATETEFWETPLGDPGPRYLPGSSQAAPDDLAMMRAPMVMQALRNRIGSAAFFSVLKEWASTRADGNGSTADFIALAEKTSSQDLTGFFDAWVRGTSKPAATPANGVPEGSGFRKATPAQVAAVKAYVAQQRAR